MAHRGRFLRALRDLLFPPRCAACHTLLPETHFSREVPAALCPECLSEWERATREPCGFCGEEVLHCRCMPELLQRAGAAALFKAVYYMPHTRTPVQNRVIYHIKESTEETTPDFLAATLLPEILATLSERGIDPAAVTVTYLPRTRRAVRLHGTDQARALARSLARLGDFSSEVLIRRRRGGEREQKQLSVHARMENAKRSFIPMPGITLSGRTVLLVDDLITSGAGLTVCTGLLRRMGADTVLCVAVAGDAALRDPG